MNSNRTTIRRGFTAVTAATAFFAVVACGAEVTPQPNDIGGTQQKKEADPPAQAPRTSIPRGSFGDEYGSPTTRPKPARDRATVARPGIDFGA